MPGADGHRCPSREHAPQAVEETQALEVVNFCAGQIRTAGMGAFTGLDLVAALAIARARGYDESILAELLAEASHGITEGINAK